MELKKEAFSHALVASSYQRRGCCLAEQRCNSIWHDRIEPSNIRHGFQHIFGSFPDHMLHSVLFILRYAISSVHESKQIPRSPKQACKSTLGEIDLFMGNEDCSANNKQSEWGDTERIPWRTSSRSFRQYSITQLNWSHS